MYSKIFLFLACVVMYTNRVDGQSNDHMFPAAASAKPYIDFDPHGFIINGRRTFLVSAGLEYARIPHELWRDRLLRLKRCGFNCVEFYTFWNFHEAIEGKFEFSGDHDLNAFLKLVKQMDMYAIPRVGPYYCAEWDFGGYPHWLRQKRDLIVRAPNAPFEKYTDRFLGKLIPIISANQINYGGAVILVQLENEHPASWGTYIPDEYFRHLQKTALSLGIEVPYFFSGLHHGSDPAGDEKDLFDPKRPSPWFTTEFWSVWYDKYGSGKKEADEYGRRTWKIIAHGGNGYNYYMAHGGTNFGYTNDDEDAASYDYGAAVGQTGDLRPLYYQFKRNALFAESFQLILENSNASEAYKNILTDSSLHTNTRASVKGDIVFVDNDSKHQKETQIKIGNSVLPSQGVLIIDPGEILPVVHHFKLTQGISIDWAATRILGIEHSGTTTTMVVYGQSGSAGEIRFSTSGKVALLSGQNAFTQEQNALILNFKFNESKPIAYTFSQGKEVIRILSVNMALSDRTWLINENNMHQVIVGPEYVGNINYKEGSHELTTEHFWQQTNVYPHIWLYGDKIAETNYKVQNLEHPNQLKFDAPWKMKDASQPAKISFNDRNWLKSINPLQMGSDGDTTAYAWYRTSVSVSSSDLYSLEISKGEGRYIVFVDDKKVASGDIYHLQFPLSKGNHLLTIFATHDGRNKLVSYVGRLDIDDKGIAGEVSLHKGKLVDISHWKFIAAKDWSDTSESIPPFTNAKDYVNGDDAFNNKKGFGWFRTTLPPGEAPDSIRFSGIDDNAIVYINGKRAGSHNGWDNSFSVPFNKSNAGENNIVLFVENSSGSGGVGKVVKAIYNNDIRLTGWHMKGGPGDFSNSGGWINISSEDIFDRPAFYKNYFTIENIPSNVHAIWRVTFKGLTHGFVWVNGHNLGRYPEKIPVWGLYIPECWLKNGRNEIVVYDEFGSNPNLVKIESEQQASHNDDVIKIN